jgi:hydrogenase maturation factor
MTMDATTGDVAGASVQIGDPIVEKLLIDALAEARGLYRAITDCGAGGLSSAIGEMADGVGACIELDQVPLKYPGLAACDTVSKCPTWAPSLVMVFCVSPPMATRCWKSTPIFCITEDRNDN